MRIFWCPKREGPPFQLRFPKKPRPLPEVLVSCAVTEGVRKTFRPSCNFCAAPSDRKLITQKQGEGCTDDFTSCCSQLRPPCRFLSFCSFRAEASDTSAPQPRAGCEEKPTDKISRPGLSVFTQHRFSCQPFQKRIVGKNSQGAFGVVAGGSRAKPGGRGTGVAALPGGAAREAALNAAKTCGRWRFADKAEIGRRLCFRAER